MGKSSSSSARDKEEGSSEGGAEALGGREEFGGGEGDTRGVSEDGSRVDVGMIGDEGGEEDVEVDSGEKTIGIEVEGSPSEGVT